MDNNFPQDYPYGERMTNEQIEANEAKHRESKTSFSFTSSFSAGERAYFLDYQSQSIWTGLVSHINFESGEVELRIESNEGWTHLALSDPGE